MSLRDQRWRATYVVEFTTRSYPSLPEASEAEISAAWLKKAMTRGETSINTSRVEIKLTGVDRIGTPVMIEEED